jgi:hypothetical protein
MYPPGWVLADASHPRMPGPSAMENLLSGAPLHERMLELMRIRARFDYIAWNRLRYSTRIEFAHAQACIGIAFEDMPDLLLKAGSCADTKDLAAEFLHRAIQARNHLAEARVPDDWTNAAVTSRDDLAEKWRTLCEAFAIITDKPPIYGNDPQTDAM